MESIQKQEHVNGFPTAGVATVTIRPSQGCLFWPSYPAVYPADVTQLLHRAIHCVSTASPEGPFCTQHGSNYAFPRTLVYERVPQVQLQRPRSTGGPIPTTKPTRFVLHWRAGWDCLLKLS